MIIVRTLFTEDDPSYEGYYTKSLTIRSMVIEISIVIIFITSQILLVQGVFTKIGTVILFINLVISAIVLPIAISAIRRLYYHFWEKSLIVEVVFFIEILLISLIGLYELTNWDVKNTKHFQYYGTKIITSDSTYTSDSLHYYIGKTENYVFIYNTPDKSATIIPSSEVRKMILKTK